MASRRVFRPYSWLSVIAVVGSTAVACSSANLGSESSNVTDVPHTPVERQSIGNCWLYAQASWAESMNLAATGEEFDVSQSYWTYWHWFDQLTSGWSWNDEISTGGNQWKSNDIVLQRGLMPENSFVPQDSENEMSWTQKSALSKMNVELESGRLKDADARSDGKLVREVLDDAWGLTPEVRAMLDQVFGEDGSLSLRYGDADAEGTPIIPASQFAVQYVERETDPDVPTIKTTTLDVAINEWETASYPSYSYYDDGNDLDERRRDFQIRVQRALHDSQPVVITWDVDFNAMDSEDEELLGSFNLTTLGRAGNPGRQGGHMTVLEDYEATTEQYGVLAAGVTLDPEDPEDQAKLAAALLPSTSIKFFRIKNSWGAFRDDRASAPGFPGYHDLYMDYLNGPISWCPSVKGEKTEENCTGEAVPFNSVMLPPGY